MSVAIVHRPRVQVPWVSIIVVLAIAVAAALVIVLSIQASARIPAPTSAAGLSTAGASVWTAAEARERPPVVRAHRLRRDAGYRAARGARAFAQVEPHAAAGR